MKHFLFFIVFLCTGFLLKAQLDTTNPVVKDILLFQADLNKEFKDSTKSPLRDSVRRAFVKHAYFPINLKYCVEAKLVVTPDEVAFPMITTSKSRPSYRKYGEVHFKLKGKAHQLNVYQSIDLSKFDGYRDYIFIPFTDLTSGDESYEGGRYIDLRIPKGNTIVVDFNKAYNPYCAYAKQFSCPIPPAENSLKVRIEAGVLKPDHH